MFAGRCGARVGAVPRGGADARQGREPLQTKLTRAGRHVRRREGEGLGACPRLGIVLPCAVNVTVLAGSVILDVRIEDDLLNGMELALQVFAQRLDFYARAMPQVMSQGYALGHVPGLCLRSCPRAMP